MATGQEGSWAPQLFTQFLIFLLNAHYSMLWSAGEKVRATLHRQDSFRQAAGQGADDLLLDGEENESSEQTLSMNI